MKTALLFLALASSAHADPRPAGGNRITNIPVSPGTCRKQLVYLNKFSTAYQTVCNPNPATLPGFLR